jgi:hypothetical protein
VSRAAGSRRIDQSPFSAAEPDERTAIWLTIDTSPARKGAGTTTPAGASPAEGSPDRTVIGSRGPGPKALASKPLGRMGRDSRGRERRGGRAASADRAARVLKGRVLKGRVLKGGYRIEGRGARDRSGLAPPVTAACVEVGLAPPLSAAPPGFAQTILAPAALGRTSRAAGPIATTELPAPPGVSGDPPTSGLPGNPGTTGPPAEVRGRGSARRDASARGPASASGPGRAPRTRRRAILGANTDTRGVSPDGRAASRDSLRAAPQARARVPARARRSDPQADRRAPASGSGPSAPRTPGPASSPARAPTSM